MRFLESKSIKQKLITIIMVTSAAAVLLACLIFMAFDYSLYRKALLQNLITMARTVGDNTRSSLDFMNNTDAFEVLTSLRSSPNIVAAAVFTTNRTLFAFYPNNVDRTHFPPEIGFVESVRFADAHVEVITPVYSDEDLVGAILIKSDLRDLHARPKYYLAIVGFVGLLSLGTAYVLSSRLQQVISKPVFDLAETTRLVSREKNYSVRAIKETEDELGELIDAFNNMLAQIQERDVELQKGKDQLERRVEERTAELQNEIAERKETEERLKALALKLQQSNRELQAFAYVASHDLQEPLRKVQAFGDRLKAKYGTILNEEGRDYLERMQSAARRMQNLINDLLLFSRVSTQAHPFQTVDLQKVVREVLSDLEIRIQQTGGEVQVDPLPTLEADPVQMRQLFQNLISNALKFHQPDLAPKVTVRAEIVSPSEEDTIWANRSTVLCRIEVSDNGIGFEEKYLDRIFGVFQRLHGRQAYEGTGIGLAICRRIVERHAGTITAKSSPGQGSTFIVTLPLKQVSGEAK